MSEQIKQLLYEQVALVGKALSSPKRLQLLELLAQGEKSVDILTRETDMDTRLTSSHLRVLKEARLVRTRRDGRHVCYSLSGEDVAGLWACLHGVASEHLLELKMALGGLLADKEQLTPETRRSLLDKARRGDVVILDVRPLEEYRSAHLPYARSMPLPELQRRLAELPRDKEIIAYCRGPFCLMSHEAVSLLAENGYRVAAISEGVAEWTAAGMTTTASPPPAD